MNVFEKVFKDPEWWLSAVFVAGFVNIVSGYFKSYVDSFLGSISSWYRRRAARRRFEIHEIAKYMADDMGLIVDLRVRLIALRLFSYFSITMLTLIQILVKIDAINGTLGLLLMGAFLGSAIVILIFVDREWEVVDAARSMYLEKHIKDRFPNTPPPPRP